MRRLSVLLAFSGLLLVPYCASADTFKVSINSSTLGVNTVGTLTGSSNNNGTFAITGISGTGITGLIAAGDALFGNDNLLFPTGSRLFDVNGIAFTGIFSGQALQFNLFSTVSGYEALAFNAVGNFYDVPATASLAATTTVTPEPSSMLLSATGLLGAAFLAFRKRLSAFAAA
ncbi:MAG: PEP-CTERM sorting domain-containing protein [Janthinobacterium lividum]